MAKQSARKPVYSNTPIWHDESTQGIKPSIDPRPEVIIHSYPNTAKEGYPKTSSDVGVVAKLNKH